MYLPNTEGIYHGLPDQVYREAPGVNISSLKEMRKSPAHYLAALTEPKFETAALQFGTLTHSLLLLDERNYIVKPQDIDLRTKAGKEWKESCGAKIVIDEAQAAALDAMNDNFRSHPQYEIVFAAADKELSAFKKCPHTGILCKGRMDIVAQGSDNLTLIADIKTTDDASPGAFAKTIASFAYHQQAAFYLDLLGATSFWFIAIEKKPPFAVAIYELDSKAIQAGRQTNIQSLECLADVNKSGKFNAYPTDILSIDLPKYAY